MIIAVIAKTLFYFDCLFIFKYI